MALVVTHNRDWVLQDTYGFFIDGAKGPTACEISGVAKANDRTKDLTRIVEFR